jgi:type VI secretion system secreted protein Hcp
MSFQYYVSIKGTKQGQFKGESTKSSKGASNPKWAQCHAFEYEVAAQYDSGSGQSSGKRTHSPLVITKETGASSPQIYQASWAKELLSEVVIETRHPGTEAIVNRTTLTNATISKFEPARVFPHGVVKHPKDGYETVIFDYQDIKVQGNVA